MFDIKRMISKIESIILNGHNYAVWDPYMETLPKIKGVQKYTKYVIPYHVDDQDKFIIDRKKDEANGVIMAYISREIHFHTSGIGCIHAAYNNLKSLFDKVTKSRVMKIDKELVSIRPHSFENIEYYLACIKELQLKLGECGKFFPKERQFIELVLMNMKTPYDVLCSFHASWISRKE